MAVSPLRGRLAFHWGGGRTTFLFVAANWKEPPTSRPQFVQRCETSISTGVANCGNACSTTRGGPFASSCSVRQFGHFPLMALAQGVSDPRTVPVQFTRFVQMRVQTTIYAVRDYRPARRQPAARASASLQKYRSPREVLIRVRS